MDPITIFLTIVLGLALFFLIVYGPAIGLWAVFVILEKRKRPNNDVDYIRELKQLLSMEPGVVFLMSFVVVVIGIRIVIRGDAEL